MIGKRLKRKKRIDDDLSSLRRIVDWTVTATPRQHIWLPTTSMKNCCAGDVDGLCEIDELTSKKDNDCECLYVERKEKESFCDHCCLSACRPLYFRKKVNFHRNRSSGECANGFSEPRTSKSISRNSISKSMLKVECQICLTIVHIACIKQYEKKYECKETFIENHQRRENYRTHHCWGVRHPRNLKCYACFKAWVCTWCQRVYHEGKCFNETRKKLDLQKASENFENTLKAYSNKRRSSLNTTLNETLRTPLGIDQIRDGPTSFTPSPYDLATPKNKNHPKYIKFLKGKMNTTSRINEQNQLSATASYPNVHLSTFDEKICLALPSLDRVTIPPSWIVKRTIAPKKLPKIRSTIRSSTMRARILDRFPSTQNSKITNTTINTTTSSTPNVNMKVNRSSTVHDDNKFTDIIGYLKEKGMDYWKKKDIQLINNNENRTLKSPTTPSIDIKLSSKILSSNNEAISKRRRSIESVNDFAIQQRSMKSIDEKRVLTDLKLSKDSFEPTHSPNSTYAFDILPLLTDSSIVTCPLIIFVNPKSGGNLGKKIIQRFNNLVNPRQVFNLTDYPPEFALNLYRCLTNSRILVCGGDGTAGWVFSKIDEFNIQPQPPVAILPLGTGNDLARTLNWGGTYDDEALDSVLNNVACSNEASLDRWSISVETRSMTDVTTLDVNFPQNISQEDKQIEADPPSEGTRVMLEQAAGKGKTNLPLNVFNNYFSMGADAAIALDFDKGRRANPQRYKSRGYNFWKYFEAGFKDMVRQTWKCLTNFITYIEIDGIDKTDQIKKGKYHCLILLNIPRYAGGATPWGTSNQFETPSISDGKLELIGATTSQLAKLKIGGNGDRIAQCSRLVIETALDIPMQVDGEPILLKPSKLVVEKHSRSKVLIKNDYPAPFNTLGNMIARMSLLSKKARILAMSKDSYDEHLIYRSLSLMILVAKWSQNGFDWGITTFDVYSMKYSDIRHIINEGMERKYDKKFSKKFDWKFAIAKEAERSSEYTTEILEDENSYFFDQLAPTVPKIRKGDEEVKGKDETTIWIVFEEKQNEPVPIDETNSSNQKLSAKDIKVFIDFSMDDYEKDNSRKFDTIDLNMGHFVS
ncbi:hypothetical protein SNEBB_003956 [Seison nebaliae]|nr:hypothetical protein SNEBB_003956 [Seison nebaliae]